MEKILVINPGSTSTKVAVFENLDPLLLVTIRHQAEELDQFKNIAEQHPYRRQAIIDILKAHHIDLDKLTAVVGRGGCVRPLVGGTYHINDQMLEDCRTAYSAEHAANLGALIADEIAGKEGIPAYVVDPPVVDELSDVARVSGLPGMKRLSLFHALNQKAVARRAARELGLKYEEARLIVVHMGGGISIGAHENGRVIDVNNCYDSEGPMMPERAGTLPIGQVVKLCLSGEYTLDEIRKMLTGKGGIVAYLGTNDMRTVSTMVDEGDTNAKLVYEAMIYQTAKAIGNRATVLRGRVDAIVITGGIAYDEQLVDRLSGRVAWIAPIRVYPGEDEMKALAEGALRVLKGQEEPKEYDETNWTQTQG